MATDGSAARGGFVRDAFLRVWARPRLVAAVFGLHVATALIATGPLSAALAPLLDARPAAREMVRGDDGLWGELLADHRELSRVALASAEGAALVYALLSWLLAGGLLAALATDGEARAIGARAVSMHAGAHAARMVRVGLCGLIVRIVPLGVAGGLGYLVVHFTTDHGLAVLALAAGAALVVSGLVWSLASVAVDAARGLACADERLGALRAVGRGVRLLRRGFGAALAIAAFSAAGYALVTALAFVATAHLDSAVALALVRLSAAFARAFVTITALVAAARLARSV